MAATRRRACSAASASKAPLRQGKPATLRLLTNLPAAAVAAHGVGAVYRLRWQNLS